MSHNNSFTPDFFQCLVIQCVIFITNEIFLKTISERLAGGGVFMSSLVVCRLERIGVANKVFESNPRYLGSNKDKTKVSATLY